MHFRHLASKNCYQLVIVIIAAGAHLGTPIMSSFEIYSNISLAERYYNTVVYAYILPILYLGTQLQHTNVIHAIAIHSSEWNNGSSVGGIDNVMSNL